MKFRTSKFHTVHACVSSVCMFSFPHLSLPPLSPLHCRAKKIPIIIRRYLPDGSYEDWSVEELIIE